MRITCPNCEAQYEVDAVLIPEAGRDVQCSNCGKGWFQTKTPETDEPEAEADTFDEPDEIEAARADDDVETEVEDEPADRDEGNDHADDDPSGPVVQREPPRAPETTQTEPRDEDRSHPPQIDEDELQDLGGDADEEESTPAPDLVARKPDEKTLGILREEAEREIRARRAETGGDLSTQTDMGLDDLPPAKSGEEGVKDRLAKLRGEASEAAASATAARRDLLPDIDVINSTLKSQAERAAEAAPEAEERDEVAERRKGFRLGFSLMTIAAAVLLFLYIYAPTLAQQVPALEPALIAYVDAANVVREWLDGLLSKGVDSLSGLVAKISGE